MKLASYQLDVSAPPAVVFGTAADVGAMPQYTRDVESMVFLTPAPLQLGSRVRDTRRLLGVRRSQVIAITLFESPARFVARFSIFGVTFDNDHLFHPRPGGTRMVINVEAAGATGPARALLPFVPLAGALVRHGIRREAEDIQREAERRAAAS